MGGAAPPLDGPIALRVRSGGMSGKALVYLSYVVARNTFVVELSLVTAVANIGVHLLRARSPLRLKLASIELEASREVLDHPPAAVTRPVCGGFLNGRRFALVWAHAALSRWPSSSRTSHRGRAPACQTHCAMRALLWDVQATV